MKMRISYCSWIMLLLVVGFAAPVNAAITFSDDFEGATLDPWWTVSAQAGSITTSTDRAASGSQSAKFASTSGGEKILYLSHTFAAPVYGTVSVKVYDTGADVRSANYIRNWVFNNTDGTRAWLGAQDYDFGPTFGGNYGGELFGEYFPSNLGSGVDRTQAWHTFEIVALPDISKLTIDGQTVLTGPAAQFDEIRFGTQAPSWRPSWTYYYDDFSFVEFVEVSSIPEPSSIVIWSLCAAIIGGGGYVRRLRKVAHQFKSA